MVINFKDLQMTEKQQLLNNAIAPRPICFASTIDAAEMEKELPIYAAELLNIGKVQDAWQILLSGENI